MAGNAEAGNFAQTSSRLFSEDGLGLDVQGKNAPAARVLSCNDDHTLLPGAPHCPVVTAKGKFQTPL